MRTAQHSATSASYFLADGLGSVRQLTNAAGAVTLARAYEPYGETLSSSGASATSYGFTGEWTTTVADTALLYLRARWYAPTQARFLSKDAWPGDYSRPLSLNGWGYVEGNPINHTDPSGNVACLYGYDPETKSCKASPFAELLPPGLATVLGTKPIVTPQQALVYAGIAVCLFVLNAVTQSQAQPRTWTDFAALPEAQPTPVVLPLPLRPQATATQEPEYIFRPGHRAKSLQLHRVIDWETGLSFFDSPPPSEYLKFRVSKLRAHGYVVRPDGSLPLTRLWTGGPYLDAYGNPIRFPPKHVTVYHSDRAYWDAWHQADLANVGTQNISKQVLAIYDLREP